MRCLSRSKTPWWCWAGLRRESDLGAGGDVARDQARADLRVAIRLLKVAEERAGGLWRNAARSSGRAQDGLKERELLSVRANIQHQLARAYRSQGLTYPDRSADRTASLTRALQQIDQIAATDQIRWQTRLDRIDILRLLGRRTAAERSLDALAADEPPANIVQQATAQRIELLLVSGQAAEAWQRFGRADQNTQYIAAELELARVATLVALWQTATKNQQVARARSWQSKALAIIERTEQHHGAYWARRAESLLASTIGSGSADLELLVRTAQNHFRRGKLDDAVTAFGRAASTAIDAGLEDRALDMYATAAFIRYQQQDLPDALSRYRQTAVRLSRAAKASDVHKAAVMIGVKLVRGGADDSLAVYRQLLDEHLKLWPNGPIADQMRLRLGMLLESEKEWQPAIEQFQAIAIDRASREMSLDHLYRCYEASFAESRLAGRDYKTDVAAAVTYMERIVLGGQGQLPEVWSPAARRAVLLAARLRTKYMDSGFVSTRSMLTTAIATASDAPAQWRSEAHSLLALAHAHEQRFDAAADAVKQVADAELWGLLEGLRHISQQDSSLARLQLDVVDRLDQQSQVFKADERLLLDRARGEAFVALGELKQARAVFAQLAVKHSRDGAIQQAYADVLLQGAGKQWSRAALAQCRKVLAGSKPQSQGWFRAKYGVAVAHYKLGNSQQAAKVIRLLKALHPDLGGPELRASFNNLLASCQK